MLARITMWFLFLMAVATARADDWPQWMGPTRDDVWQETGIIEKFPEGGPKILWRVPISGGYSGPAVVKDKVFVTDYLKSSGEIKNDPSAKAVLTGRERVLCLRVSDGKELWKHEYDCPYQISYPAGPRT